jgi:hypothetical protein
MPVCFCDGRHLGLGGRHYHSWLLVEVSLELSVDADVVVHYGYGRPIVDPLDPCERAATGPYTARSPILNNSNFDKSPKWGGLGRIIPERILCKVCGSFVEYVQN